MRLVLTLGDLILFDVRLLERDDEPTEQPPAHIALGFASTERSEPFTEDRTARSHQHRREMHTRTTASLRVR